MHIKLLGPCTRLCSVHEALRGSDAIMGVGNAESTGSKGPTWPSVSQSYPLMTMTTMMMMHVTQLPATLYSSQTSCCRGEQ